MSIQTKNFNKKNQVSLIFGELANTYYSVNSATQDMPIVIFDTQELETSKTIKNNYTVFQISDSGTGANPAKGRELMQTKLTELDSIINQYDVVNIFHGKCGGTSGSSLEAGDYIKSKGKLVLFHPMGMISTDASAGDRMANLEYSNDALKDHNHCNLEAMETKSLKDIGNLVKTRIDNMLSVANFRNFDNNDFLNLFTNKEFTVATGNNPIELKTKVQKFFNQNISTYFIGQSSESGDLNKSQMLNLLLQNRLVDNSRSKTATKFGDNELVVLACR